MHGANKREQPEENEGGQGQQAQHDDGTHFGQVYNEQSKSLSEETQTWRASTTLIFS
jgi:hypothetical protein